MCKGNKVKMIKSLKDSLSVNRIFSPGVWSSIVTFPDSDRYQTNINTYIKCLCMPQNALGNVLILKGGPKHMNSDSYYIKTVCMLLNKNIRIFLFEKLLPVANPNFGHDVSDCLKFIRENFNGPNILVGYSMGGILMFSYLSFGYDQADLYIPVCCPINLTRFRDKIITHPIFNYSLNKTYRTYNVKGFEELLELIGTNAENYKNFEDNLVPNLNKFSSKWINRMIYILSIEDPLTCIYDLELLDRIPITYKIESPGWHCCLDALYLSSVLMNNFFEMEKIVNASEIKCTRSWF